VRRPLRWAIGLLSLTRDKIPVTFISGAVQSQVSMGTEGLEENGRGPSGQLGFLGCG